MLAACAFQGYKKRRCGEAQPLVEVQTPKPEVKGAGLCPRGNRRMRPEPTICAGGRTDERAFGGMCGGGGRRIAYIHIRVICCHARRARASAVAACTPLGLSLNRRYFARCFFGGGCLGVLLEVRLVAPLWSGRVCKNARRYCRQGFHPVHPLTYIFSSIRAPILYRNGAGSRTSFGSIHHL